MTRFLTAEWRNLAMVNYLVDPEVLYPFVPRGTELDSWHDKTYVSLVGFMFLQTRVLGIPVPFHMNFEEVNLRFYVRRKAGGEWRRGVVFIKEIVPRWAIAYVARVLYNEKYVSLPMRHEILQAENGLRVEYSWQFQQRWNHLEVKSKGPFEPLGPGSEAEFITEHYWGYSAQRNGDCAEYRVEHPSWNVCPASDALIDCDVSALYGPQFEPILQGTPASAFLAAGSPITVGKGQRL